MFFRKIARVAAPRVTCRLRLPHARPVLEALESRVVPYAVSGNAWPSPQLVTISFVPDGTIMAAGNPNGGYYYSNLFSAFNQIPGVTSANQWENVILKAAQQWAQQTNVNLSVVADDGEYIGAGPYQQGNPNFGDIRIGGFDFGVNELASTAYPPPVNNYSVAGDIAFNTDYNFNIGSTFDLFTVAMHESGHALGMAHSSSSSAVMFPYYTGAFTGLSADDIAGVRSIYSGGNPRAHDAYNSNGHSDGSFTTAADITSTIDPASLTSVVTGLDITTTTQVEYFKFTTPSGSAGTMNVTVQSTGLSLLTPKLTVYNAAHVAIGSATFRLASGAVQDGATLSVNVSGVVPGATYYVAVGGVDRTAFSTGAYALTLNLGIGANPTVPLPSTQLANGNPLSGSGGTPQTPGPDEASPSATTRPTADANMVNGLVSHGAAVVAPVSVAQISTPVIASQMAAVVASPARSQAGGAAIARADAITADGAEPLAAPAQKDDANPAPMPQAAPDDASEAVGQPALNDPWLGTRPDLPVEQSASAPAVAEAGASDWTPDGALAAASVVFGGAWLRWHAAHRQDERRRHERAVNEKQDAP